MKNGKKGSLTIAATLLLCILTGSLFTLLEGVRYIETKRLVTNRVHYAMESVFANYNATLWEQYHLLATVEEDMDEILGTCIDPEEEWKALGTDWLTGSVREAEVSSLCRLTDEEGKVYIKAISNYMKDNVAYEVAKEAFEQYRALEELLHRNNSNENAIEDALEELEKAKEVTEAGGYSYTTAAKKDCARTGGDTGLLETIQRLQKTQILELVLEDTEKLSDAGHDLDKSVSHRELAEGIGGENLIVDWIDRVLLQQYLMTYFSDYTKESGKKGLAYELEYLIGGKEDDISNLRTVANEILLIREGANLAYLLTDQEKMAEALLLATGIASLAASPQLTEVVKYGVLVSWAFAESVLDVRGLFLGKKIPLMKSRETWTIALENVGSVGEGYASAKESPYGLGYSSYLGILLLFQEEETLAYRAMDLQEWTIQEADASLQMDHMIVEAAAEVTYEYKGMFLSGYRNMQTVKTGYSYHERQGR